MPGVSYATTLGSEKYWAFKQREEAGMKMLKVEEKEGAMERSVLDWDNGWGHNWSKRKAVWNGKKNKQD